MSKPQDSKNNDIKDMLEALLATDSDEFRFSEWEIDFIDSCEKQLRVKGATLSPKQQAVIEKLYAKVIDS